jgi:DNA polymerase III alpha subunit
MLNLKKEYSDGEIAGKTDLEILDDLDALQRDPATAELIRSGRTIGCFYIESPSMRSLFQRMRCECYEDVVAASSIIRPGVAESGMMNEYVKRRRKVRGEKWEARGGKILDFGFGILDCKSAGEKPEAKNRTGDQPIPHSQSSIQNLKSKIENQMTGCQPVPQLAELLAETYGVMVYQEDVIKVVHELGGLSLGEADILRRAMAGKTDGRKAMKSLTERFFAGCRARGVPEPAIEELWRQIETFASYAFCKGHSAAFAVLSYQVAYLKAHYPAEFMAAVLSNGGGFYGAAAYIQECRRMGLRVVGPDVNESDVEYRGKTERREKEKEKRKKNLGTTDCTDFTDSLGQSVKSVQSVVSLLPFAFSLLPSGFVRVGFAAIKNFPLDLAQRIVRVRKKRPFESLEDFLRRVRPGHEAAEKLIRVGAFDRFGIPRERLFLELDMYYQERMEDKSEQLLDGRESSQADKSNMNTFPEKTVPHPKIPCSPLPVFNLKSKIPNLKSDFPQRVADEIELLGYGVSAHPLELLPDEVWRGTVAARDMGRHVGRRVTMIGWLIASKLVRTRNSRAGCPCHFMKFLSLEDLTDTFEVTLFPRAYRRFAPLTLRPGPFRIRGKIANDQDALSLVADHIEILGDSHHQDAKAPREGKR